MELRDGRGEALGEGSSQLRSSQGKDNERNSPRICRMQVLFGMGREA
ncbi:hypothetical protein B2K_39190 [Paenibacillus mucilaginosus K02]|uniref:Uncharacterized protein n=1 Tax=Paenibacillus mucilaginosus K02 TaxID=997761 RepID=R9UPB7_9BACL|nr:hypothetical protein B2K_39190 [Paenibacillus mucilaginosus K02]